MIPGRVLARSARAVVLVAALVVPAVLAQPAAASGQVHGIVTRAGGAPLPATSIASVGVKACATPSTETCSAVAITSATTAGGYNLGLEAGDYDLWVVNLGNTRPLGGPFPVSVPEGGTALLSPEVQVAIVQGTVTSSGVPYPPNTAGAAACAPNEPQGESCPSLRAQFDFDGDGTYVLALPPGEWALRGFHTPGSGELSDENPTITFGDGDLVTQNFNIPTPAIPPSIMVMPSSGLVDGQSVTVDGSGYTPSGDNVWVGQCLAAPDPAICDKQPEHQVLVPVDALGEFSTSITVHETFTGGTDANPDDPILVDCTVAPGCFVSGGQSNPSISAFQPISFGAPPGAPSITVVPSTELDTGDSVDVSGTGFTPGQPVSVLQCANGPPIGENAPCNVLGAVHPLTDNDGSFAAVSLTVFDPMPANETTPPEMGPYPCGATGCRVVAAQGGLFDTEQISFGASGTVSGTVLDGSGSPAVFGGVAACPAPGTIESCPGLLTAFADADGNYTLTLPAGTYNITGFGFGGSIFTAGVTVTVAEDDELVRNFEVLFGTISGSVTDGEAPFPEGTAGVVLCPDPASPGPGPLCPGIRAGFANAGGNYSLLLPPGTYNVAGFLLTDGDPVVTAVESITIGDGDALVRNYTIGDTDGVPDEVEDDAPNGGDGNNDGTPDSEQPNVSSLPSAVTGNPYVTLAAPDGTTLVDVEAIDPSTLPPPPGGQALPVGVLSFEVQGMTPGGTVTVEVVTPADTAPASYLKFQNGAWVDFTANSSFAGDIVTLSLTDGGAGDADGTANGVIVDPGAPALASADAEGNESDQGLHDVEVVAELASRTDPKKVRIDYCTADGSAAADADYRADCKHVNLNKHESSAPIKLKIRGDQLVEGDEDFFVDLSTQGGTLVKDQFRIVIRDDD